MTRTLDPYLTRRAQRTWPRAQVWRSEGNYREVPLSGGQASYIAYDRTYTLRRRLHDWVTLGTRFGEARAALDALAASETVTASR